VVREWLVREKTAEEKDFRERIVKENSFGGKRTGRICQGLGRIIESG
jgi:hypothetical protein